MLKFLAETIPSNKHPKLFSPGSFSKCKKLKGLLKVLVVLNAEIKVKF